MKRYHRVKHTCIRCGNVFWTSYYSDTRESEFRAVKVDECNKCVYTPEETQEAKNKILELLDYIPESHNIHWELKLRLEEEPFNTFQARRFVQKYYYKLIGMYWDKKRTFRPRIDKLDAALMKKAPLPDDVKTLQNTVYTLAFLYGGLKSIWINRPYDAAIVENEFTSIIQRALSSSNMLEGEGIESNESVN